MKYLKSILMVTLSILVIGACGNKSEDEAGQASESMEEGLTSEQTAFVSNVKDQLAKIEPLMKEVETKIEKTSGGTKEDLTDAWVDLVYKKEKLEKTIANVQKGSAEDWERTKKDISSQWNTLMSTYQELKKEVDDNV